LVQPPPSTTRPTPQRPQHKSHRRHGSVFPFRESNEIPGGDYEINNFSSPNAFPQESRTPSVDRHSSFRSRFFNNNGRKMKPEEEFSMDPEIQMLQKMGSVYSSLFNMMAQQFGNYD
jgi:hypothetical protein